MSPAGPDEQPRYTVAAVARRLGVAPATLRTWDRRYGLGPTEHLAGTQRRYTHPDLMRLDLMRRLISDGVAPRDAARLAQRTEGHLPVDPAPPAAQRPVAAGGAETDEPDRRPVDSVGDADLAAGGSGGRVMALPGASPAARGLARAAMALDAEAVSRIIDRSLEGVGVLATWEELLYPVLVAAGRRWALTGEGVDVEHLLSECSVGALRRVAAPPSSQLPSRPVLLAGSEDDQHSLPLYAIAAALAEVEVTSQVLGGTVPADALRSAVARTAPPALFVWSQLLTTADAAALDALPVTRPATRLVVGGPGWRVGALPRRAAYARSLPQAVALLRAPAAELP